jgi:Ger(x)C family germination protein
MKRILSVILFIFIAVSASGCALNILPEKIEINKLMMVQAVGVDKDLKDPNNVCITVLSKKQAMGGKSGEQANPKGIVLSDKAPTFLEAEREFQSYSDKRMFWGHVDFYLVGEEAAREGIARYIDFFSRDNDMRVVSKVYIIKGSTAREFIEKSSTGEYYMPDRLRGIGENSKLYAGAQELELLEFIQWLNNKYSCAVAPVLSLKQTEHSKKEGDQPPMDIDLNGYAVFKNLKLVNIIDKDMARGENFLLNRITTGVIQVKDPDGEIVGLDIIEHRTKISPSFKDGELKGMKVKVTLSSNINETHSTTIRFTEDMLNYLSNKQSDAVKKQIEGVIRLAQENNTDFVDMANVFGTYHPVLWDKYKKKWDEIFPSLPISVEVDSKINRTYDIREPNGFFEEEHK